MKKNAALLLEYDGSRYGGWQRQKGSDNTIQGKLETVLERMTGTFQEVHGSGRTDAGVHAAGQVANVHLDTELSEGEVMAYLNRYLPEDIRVLAVRWVQERFHSRLWAKEKTYTYWVETEARGPVFQRRYLYILGEPLDRKAMEEAARLLCGTHDFASFCTDRNKRKSAVRTLKRIEIRPHDSRLEFVMTGDGFLYNMVRILVGTLIEVGQGKREPMSVPKIFEAEDRKAAGFTAPACGLFLKEITYETELFEGIRR